MFYQASRPAAESCTAVICGGAERCPTLAILAILAPLTGCSHWRSAGRNCRRERTKLRGGRPVARSGRVQRRPVATVMYCPVDGSANFARVSNFVRRNSADSQPKCKRCVVSSVGSQDGWCRRTTSWAGRSAALLQVRMIHGHLGALSRGRGTLRCGNDGDDEGSSC